MLPISALPFDAKMTARIRTVQAFKLAVNDRLNELVTGGRTGSPFMNRLFVSELLTVGNDLVAEVRLGFDWYDHLNLRPETVAAVGDSDGLAVLIFDQLKVRLDFREAARLLMSDNAPIRRIERASEYSDDSY